MAKKKTKKTALKSKRPVGKTTGVGVNATWVLIFQKNEKLPTARKLTDAQITKFMQFEFFGRNSKVFETVSVVRGRYNRGLLTRGKVPTIQSKQYGG